MGNPEVNVFKSLYFVNLAMVFLSLVLLLFFPAHNQLAEAYLNILIGGVALVILDLVFVGEPFEFFNTITADEDYAPVSEKKFLLQNFFPYDSLKYCLVIALFLGTLLGGFYVYSYTVQRTAYIAVPRFFAVAPVTLTAQSFDVWQVGFVVSNVEELIWVGVMFPIIWGLFAFVLLLKTENRLFAFVVAMFIAALLTGWLASWVFHMFVYGGNLYAYANGQFHFTVSSLLAGTTGTIIGGVIAHMMHNVAVAMAQHSQSFAALPIQAFAGGSP